MSQAFILLALVYAAVHSFLVSIFRFFCVVVGSLCCYG